MYPRTLGIELPSGQSAFLWGPRKTGKSTLLRQQFPRSARFDLLDTRLLLEFTRAPWTFAERVRALDASTRAHPIIIDEVQKVPALLDEVHRLIESEGFRFVLCGSSARKLKRGRANLLGGRAWRFALHPLTSTEIPDFDLLRALNHGLIPQHYDGGHPRRALAGYVDDYLKEEVFAEGLTRNAPAFSRFFEALSFSHGELINFSNIARDCGVDSKTVREYFQILVDTLLGVFVEPFARRRSRAILTRIPKFYLFDVGLAGYVTRRRVEAATGPDFGRALEHFVLMELLAYRSYRERDFPIRFWRTKTGLECDFVLGPEGEVVVEVKAKSGVQTRDLSGCGRTPRNIGRATPFSSATRPLPGARAMGSGSCRGGSFWNDSGRTRCSDRPAPLFTDESAGCLRPAARRPHWRNPHDRVGPFTPPA